MKHYNDESCIPDNAVYKEVIVIGNGPSGIMLSYILAGYWPYYNGNPHPDEMLTARLQSINKEVSLIQQDLRFLSQGLEGRSNSPVPLLIDMLLHPGADIGLDMPSLLEWRYHPEHCVDHLILGKGPPGGAWQAMDSNVLTVSLASWMELPGFDFRLWDVEKNGSVNPTTRNSRASVHSVAQYYKDYVKINKLEQFFKNGVLVTAVRPVDFTLIQSNNQEGAGEEIHGIKPHVKWIVEGHEINSQTSFCYICENLVIAVGCTDLPNKLKVPGEMDNPSWAFHSLSSLEKGLIALEEEIQKQNLSEDTSCDPVMIVGAGLSAADAIISTRFHSLPVVHVFRRKPGQFFGRQLPQNMYPEYHKVHQMMCDSSCTYPFYTAFAEHKICSVGPGKTVELEDSAGKRSVHKVSVIAILIGSQPNLGFLPQEMSLNIDASKPFDCKSNLICVDPFTYRAIRGPQNLYAAGPITGDNFVRFLQGGVVAVASDINKEKTKLESVPC